MKVVAFAYRDLGVIGLESALSAGAEVVKVISHEESETDKEWHRSVAEFCRAKGLSLLTPLELGRPELIEEINGLGPDYFLLLDYQAPLGRRMLEIPKAGCVNVLLGPSPAYPEFQPVVRTLLADIRKTGVTAHLVGPDGSAGDTLARSEYFVDKQATGHELYLALCENASGVVSGLVTSLKENGPKPLEAVEQEAGSWSGIPIERRIMWRGSSFREYNRIRALTRPGPGATCVFLGDEMIVWRAAPDDDLPALIHPGEILFDEGKPMVGTSRGALRLEEVSWRGETLIDKDIVEALSPYEMEKFE